MVTGSSMSRHGTWPSNSSVVRSIVRASRVASRLSRIRTMERGEAARSGSNGASELVRRLRAFCRGRVGRNRALVAAACLLLGCSKSSGTGGRLTDECNLVGSWKTPPDGLLVVSDNGSWEWTHGQSRAAGHWEVTESSLTVADEDITGPGDLCPRGVRGRYSITWAQSCGTVSFAREEDPCLGRGRVLNGARLERAAPSRKVEHRAAN